MGSNSSLPRTPGPKQKKKLGFDSSERFKIGLKIGSYPIPTFFRESKIIIFKQGQTIHRSEATLIHIYIIIIYEEDHILIFRRREIQILGTINTKKMFQNNL